MTLKISAPLPLSACTGFIVVVIVVRGPVMDTVNTIVVAIKYFNVVFMVVLIFIEQLE
jgi:hypothetical protein